MNDIKVIVAGIGGILQNFIIHGQPVINIIIGILTIAYLVKRLRSKKEDV